MSRLTDRFVVFAGVVAGLLALFLFSGTSMAVTGADWNAGNIMEDGVFFNGADMSTGDIQNFLNSKVPTCDTYGTQPYGGTTRAAYGASRGYPAPYTCLKNYIENPTTHQNNANGGGVSGGWTSASIIKYAADTYNINPKVLIVLLQKEQGLVTDDWPWTLQYRSATGYGCPDTAPCDAEYYGFYNQVMNAASQFRRYANNPGSYRHKAYQTNLVYWSPNTAACGGTNVYIQNQTTAGLYNYTPYQPNAAALANLYGTGDGCSAYGNRNFWRTYNDWFNPIDTIRNGVTMTTIAQPDSTPALGQTVTYTVSFRNNLSANIIVDAVGVVGRAGGLNGANRDFGWQGPITLQPGVTQTFTFTSLIRDVGTIYAWPALNINGQYIHYNNWGASLNSHAPNLSLSAPLASSLSSPTTGQTSNISAVVKNNEDQPILVNALGLPARYYGTYNYDVNWVQPGLMQPNETRSLAGSITFDKPGPYSIWTSANIAGQYITLSNALNYDVKNISPNFTLSYTETPNPSPALGEDVSVKFKLKNNLSSSITMDAIGVVGRYDSPYNGSNKDFGWVGPVTFSAGEEKTYTTFTSNVSELNKLYAWVAVNYKGSYTQYSNWGFQMSPHIPNLTLSSPLTVNGGVQPTIGVPAPITATVKNNEAHPIRYSAAGIPARYYNVYNYDTGWQGAGVLSSSGQVGDSIPLSGSINFNKAGPFTVWTSINIGGRYITIGNIRALNF